MSLLEVVFCTGFSDGILTCQTFVISIAWGSETSCVASKVGPQLSDGYDDVLEDGQKRHSAKRAFVVVQESLYLQ